LSGRTCNKIGVSYEAFRLQPSACSAPVGTCLSAQPDDYFQEDDQKRARGEVGQYLLEFVAGAEASVVRIDDSSSNLLLQISMGVIETSVITLTVSADDLVFISNRSPGRILVAYVEPFESLSRDGVLVARVANVGTLAADYDITVGECSSNISPILSQRVSLAVAQEKELRFAIYTTTYLAAENYCKISMYNALGGLEHFLVFNFSTSATDIDRGSQEGTPTKKLSPAGPTTTSPKKLAGCAARCGSFFSVVCFVVNGCIAQLLRVVGVVVAGIALLLCCIKCAPFLCMRAVPALWRCCSQPFAQRAGEES